jgi:hypothetical protein
MTTLARLTVLTALLGLTLTWSVGAQTVGSVLGLLATADVSTLVPPGDPALTDPAASEPATTDPPHLPKGGVYFLFGTAKNDVDPQNPFNEVVSFDTTDPSAIAGAFRRLGDQVKIGMLTNQVELKYFLAGRTCGGGSPRIQFGISGDGDGTFNQSPGGPDQNVFGYLGDKPFGGGCLMDQWIHEDMTNNVPKWDLSQYATAGAGVFCGGNAMICTWSQMVLFLNTVFPNHRVLNANLVDDSGSFFAADRGCAYFDLVTTGARTLNDHTDTSGGGQQPNNC